MKKKTVFLAVVLEIMINRGVSAQGYPVIDISSIMAAITNGYTMVQELYSMYEMVKTSYDQLQKQIKSFESFDFNSLDANDPLGSWGSLLTYADRMVTYEQNIEAIIYKKDIKIGNNSYSLADIFNLAVGAVQNMAAGGTNDNVDPFEKKLSPEERAVFHQKYGVSYGNYMRMGQMGDMLKKKAAEVVGYSGSLQKDLTDDRERLSAITNGMYDSESTIQQQQVSNAIMSIMAQDIKTQANLLGDIANQFATVVAQDQMIKQAMQEELNMNSLGITEGFLMMLEEMSPASDYR